MSLLNLLHLARHAIPPRMQQISSVHPVIGAVRPVKSHGEAAATAPTQPSAASFEAHVKIQDIQVLRGIAILSVLIVHASLGTLIFELIGFTNPGWIGVELFFVISGFVVIRSFARSGFSVISFISARIYRLYPALIIFTMSVLLLNSIIPQITPEFALQYFYVDQLRLMGQTLAIMFGVHPTATFGQSYTNGIMWSLSVEMQFYAVLAGIVIILLQITKSQFVIIQFLWIAALLVAVIGLGSRPARYFGLTTGLGNFVMASKFEFMAIGMLAGMLPATKLLPIAQRLRPFSWILLVSSLLLVSLCREPNASVAIAGDILEGVVMVFCALAFIGLVVIASEAGLPLKPGILRNILVFFGDRSFTVYVFHFFIYMLSFYFVTYVYLIPLTQKWSWPVSQLVFSLCIMLPLIEVIYRFVELPMIAIGKRRLAERRIAQKSEVAPEPLAGPPLIVG